MAHRASRFQLPPSLRAEVDALATAIEDEVVVERDGWAAEAVARVYARFAESGVPLTIQTAVVWAAAPQAITLPDGRTYVSRELLSRGLTDGGLAFALAHEQAHHDLEHFAAITRWSGRLEGLPGSSLVSSLAAFVSSSDPQARELDADRSAFERCKRAGYTLDDALSLFQICKSWLLDRRVTSAVWSGPLTSGATHPPIEVRVSALRSLANPRETDFATWLRERRKRA